MSETSFNNGEEEKYFEPVYMTLRSLTASRIYSLWFSQFSASKGFIEFLHETFEETGIEYIFPTENEMD